MAELATRGDGRDAGRIDALLAERSPEVVAAAGGDGTVREVVAALLRAKAPRPALGFVPLGTGNNAARSHGMRSLRGGGAAAATRAITAIAQGERRAIDIGLLDDRPFVGSFAVGMDADVLSVRNRIRGRVGPSVDGYALYLASFLLALPRSGRPVAAKLRFDEREEASPLTNLAALTAPIYAGVFRFDDTRAAVDGLLSVHVVRGWPEYLVEYPAAWSRHLRALGGARVAPSHRLSAARTLAIELERPLAAQIDGEACGARSSYRVRVLPGAIRACAPVPTTP